MKTFLKPLLVVTLLLAFSCQNDNLTENEDPSAERRSKNFNVNFQYKSTITVGREGSTEITAFDKTNNRLFVVDADEDQILVWDISNIESPIELSSISVAPGAPNSVSVHKGKLAVAIEAENKQMPGNINVYDTSSLTLLNSYQVGALPDMVTFSPNGQYIVSANEGEPSDDYLVDPAGSVSIIEVANGQLTTLTFDAFNGQEMQLESQGFRVFGPGATLAQDVEPEYVAISKNSNYAWVTLQENNGMAKVNLQSKVIESIYPFGYKNYDLPGNEIDASNRDGEYDPIEDENGPSINVQNWPVFGMYQPDAIEYVKIGGVDYLFTANEGDAREYFVDVNDNGDYDEDEDILGYIGEDRVKDLDLDESAFPVSEDFQNEANLGRLKATISQGDTDNDGDFDELYSYGARSFSVWSGNGNLLYDSGSDIVNQTIGSGRYNGEFDDRSDDKGAEPESVEILNVQGNKYILFVGLERNDQILVYDVSNPLAPQFLMILSHPGDEAPEGLLAIPGQDSPSGKDLLVVANEDSGTITFYENQ